MNDARTGTTRPGGLKTLAIGSLALLAAMALPSTARTPTLAPGELPPAQPLPYRTYASTSTRPLAPGFDVARFEALAEQLVQGQRIPGLDIDGRDGFFDMADDSPGSRQAEILDWLNQRSHDMVIVGMGMPRQEEWIERVQHRIPTRVLVPTGAYLDYQVGEQTLPPRWMGRAGLEGVYRLFRSPRRLAYRYLLEPLVLAWRLIARPHPQKGGA